MIASYCRSVMFTASWNASRSLFDRFRSNINKVIENSNAINTWLGYIEEKTGVQKECLLYGIIAVCSLYLMFGWCNYILCNCICFFYPCIQSLKAIESPRKADDTEWLMYWTTFGFINILEYFSDLILFWIPFYWFSKCVFLLWVMLPGKNSGSHVLYNKIIKPCILKKLGATDPFHETAKDFHSMSEKSAIRLDKSKKALD